MNMNTRTEYDRSVMRLVGIILFVWILALVASGVFLILFGDVFLRLVT